jgi:hypothetical protein
MAKLKCVCYHPVQDRLHGKEFRVHNRTKEGKYRCTVCLRERDGIGLRDIQPKQETTK